MSKPIDNSGYQTPFCSISEDKVEVNQWGISSTFCSPSQHLYNDSGITQSQSFYNQEQPRSNINLSGESTERQIEGFDYRISSDYNYSQNYFDSNTFYQNSQLQTFNGEYRKNDQLISENMNHIIFSSPCDSVDSGYSQSPSCPHQVQPIDNGSTFDRNDSISLYAQSQIYWKNCLSSTPSIPFEPANLNGEEIIENNQNEKLFAYNNKDNELPKTDLYFNNFPPQTFKSDYSVPADYLGHGHQEKTNNEIEFQPNGYFDYNLNQSNNQWNISYLKNEEFYNHVNNCAERQVQAIEYFQKNLENYLQTFSSETIIAILGDIKKSFSQQYKAKKNYENSKLTKKPSKKEKTFVDSELLNLEEDIPKYCCKKSYKNIIMSRSKSNVTFQDKIGLVLGTKKYKLTKNTDRLAICFLVTIIVKLIKDDKQCTPRDIYYQNMNMFKNMDYINRLIKDLCITVGVSRIELNIVASPKGLIFGDLVFVAKDGSETDCKKTANGILVPDNVRQITVRKSNAKFILLVEKYATFFQLVNDGICNKFEVIMFTGCGYPDIRTRAFVQKLWLTLKLPVFALMDGDAYGIEIMSTYRYGSYSLAHENIYLNVPEVQWLGIQADDIEEFNLLGIKYQEKELKRFEQLKKREHIRNNSEWFNQIVKMQSIGIKVEIQALHDCSPEFLLDIYLPLKLRHGNWI